MAKQKPKIKRPKYLSADVRTVNKTPTGYLNSEQFGARVGLAKMSINRALQNGKFPMQHLAIMLAPRGGTVTLINYNEVAYDFVMNMKETPKDLVPRSNEYKFLSDEEWAEISAKNVPKKKKHVEPEGSIVVATIPGVPERKAKPQDMSTANLMHKNLQIEKADIDVMVSKNELVYLADALTCMRMLAVEIRQKLDAFDVKVTPLLAAEDKPKEIRNILIKNRKEVMKKLFELETRKGIA